MTALRPVLDALPGLDVLVLGDALLDDYLHGTSTRLSREAPVPVVTVDERRAQPGGAGNVAANVAALGARVRFVSVVGADADGSALRAALHQAGVDLTDVVVETGRRTIAKRRVVAGEQMVVRFDEGDAAPLGPASLALVLSRARALFRTVDVVIVSDYGYGVLDDAVLELLAELQATTPRVLVVDARTIARYRSVSPTAVTPSYDEVSALLDPPAHDGADRAAAAGGQCDRLRDATGAQVVVVTLDRDGVVACERGRPPYRTWARPVPHSRACGAGDSFTSAFALALGAGADVPVAAELAQAAAEVVTAQDGTCTCALDDLREHLAETTTRLQSPAQLADRVALHRRQGRRIVFTNGHFDLLHRGHIDLLNRAQALGDVLVVGVNSDESIDRLHGPDRPVHPLEDRARVLAALSCVDHLVAFEETTATELVALLRPDVYVKGGDYTSGMVPEAPHVEGYGGIVQILPYLEDRPPAAVVHRARRDPRGAGLGR